MSAEPTPAEGEGPSIIDSLLGYWWVLAAGVLVILGLLFAKSRGKRKTAEFDDNLGRLAEQGEDRLAQPMDSLSDTGRMRAPNLSAIPDDILVEVGTHRALETQDIRLRRRSYRRNHQQRNGCQSGSGRPAGGSRFPHGLRPVMTRPPRAHRDSARARSRDLKLKLLEVFFVWGNKEQFLGTARELRTPAGNPAWVSGKRSSSWASRLPSEDRCSDGGAGSSVGVDSIRCRRSGRVDFDLSMSARMDVTGGGNPDAVDLTSQQLRDRMPRAKARRCRTIPSGQTTREMTAMTRRSEAPTVEQPALRPLDEPTIREKVEGAMRRKLSSEQTAELALDDLGLELGSLEQTDSQIGMKPVGGMPRGPDANAPTMVAGLDENSQRLLAAAAARHGMTSGDDQLTEHGASGTWFLTERELGGDVDLTKGRPIDPNSTASMSKFEMPEAGFDISSTSRWRPSIARTSISRSNPRSSSRSVAAAAGGPRHRQRLRHARQPDRRTRRPDLEPVTLSEVGTRSTWLAPTSTWVTGRRAQHPQRCCRKVPLRRSRKRSAC